MKNPMTAVEFDTKLVDCLQFAAKRMSADAAESLRGLVHPHEGPDEASPLARGLSPIA